MDPQKKKQGLSGAGIAAVVIGVLVVGGLVLALLAWGVMGLRGGPREGERITDQMGRLIEQAGSGERAPVDRIELESYSGGERGRAERVLQRVLNESIAIQNEYLAELQRIGWDRVLDPVRLDGDRDMTESNRILAGGREAATRLCREQESRLLAAAREAVQEAYPNAASRQEVLDGIEKGMREAAGPRQEICRMELAIIDEVAGMMGVLESDPGWTVDGEYFMFTGDDHVERFNRHLDAMQALVQQQDALRRENMDKAQQDLRKMGL